MYKHVQANLHARTRTQTHINTQTHTHKHTHTNTHTNTHTTTQYTHSLLPCMNASGEKLLVIMYLFPYPLYSSAFVSVAAIKSENAASLHFMALRRSWFNLNVIL